MTLKRKSFLILLLILFVFPCSDSYAYKFDFVTVSDVVKKIKTRFSELKTYQVNFRIVSEQHGAKKLQTGILKYKTGDKLYLGFHKPYGQKIISNGSMMWIYIPSMNVVAEQDLKADRSLFSAGTKTGLSRLFSKYHYRFLSKQQPEEQKDGQKQYTILLKQKESRSGYRKIKLWVSENFMIVRALGETSSGKKIDISFSKMKTDIDIPNGVFKFDIPSRARVIKNPMLSEE